MQLHLRRRIHPTRPVPTASLPRIHWLTSALQVSAGGGSPASTFWCAPLWRRNPNSGASWAWLSSSSRSAGMQMAEEWVE